MCKAPVNVLIVEDNHQNMELYGIMMENKGLRDGDKYKYDNVFKASNVKDALEIINKEGIFALGIIDMQLPDGSGDDVIEALKKFTDDVRIMVVSAYPAEKDCQYQWIPKPFRMDKLVLEISELLKSWRAYRSIREVNVMLSEIIESSGVHRGSRAGFL